LNKKNIFSLYRKTAKILWKTRIFYFRTPRRIHKFIIKKFVSDYLEVDGFKIYTGENDDDNFTIYGFEQHKDLILLIKKYVKKGDRVLDIGANVGKVSLLLARQVGETGKVFSFEPEENNFNLLKKNMEINNFKNIIPLRYAVTDKTEKTLLKISGTCTTHQVCTDTDVPTQEIESISIDDYFKDQKIDFMKIDAEGSEPKIIQGMKTTVKNNPQLKFVIEYNARILDSLNIDIKKIH
jgi:FkbM family methyltransferase